MIEEQFSGASPAYPRTPITWTTTTVESPFPAACLDPRPLAWIEQCCGAAPACCCPSGCETGTHVAFYDPDWALRDIEVKRRIIEEILSEVVPMERRIEGEWGLPGDPPDERVTSEWLLRLLAAIDSEHSDFREEWRP